MELYTEAKDYLMSYGISPGKTLQIYISLINMCVVCFILLCLIKVIKIHFAHMTL